jgi:hypothetical protein
VYRFVLIVALVLLVYTLIECLQSDKYSVRNLSKPAWLAIIVILPVLGPIAWLLGGRPQRPGPRPWAPPQRTTAPGPSRPPRGPDDDPDFLAGLGSDAEHEEMLKEWEQQLREREKKLRETDADEE